MMPIRTLALLALLAPAAAWADDEARVTVEGVHLCCNACVRAVDRATSTVEGASAESDRDAGTVVLIAPDIKTVQEALDALTDAGYHGTPASDAVRVKDDSGVAAGKVKTLTLSGAHNCCRGCATALTEALDAVGGIEEVKAQPRSNILEVTGDFDAKAVVDALNEAGFHVKAKKD